MGVKAQRTTLRARDRLPAFAWSVLGYNLLVILWGAFVRISGAGAGCGSHWPTCHGAVIPPSPTLLTLIEYSHRLTSGLAGVLAIMLVVWAFRARPKGDPTRFGAWLALTLVILEGLVGGMQVLLGLTADSTDPARGLVQGVHLANTFALTGAMLLTAVWASGAPRWQWRGQGWVAWGAAAALAGMLLVGMAGAVTALGDLLFRPEGAVVVDTLRRDFSATATIIERLRVVHPVLAVVVSAYLLVFAARAVAARPTAQARVWQGALVGLVVAQMLAGFVNVALKAPGWMQLTHLFLACVMWLVTLMLTYALLSVSPSHSTRKEVTA